MCEITEFIWLNTIKQTALVTKDQIITMLDKVCDLGIDGIISDCANRLL